MPLRSLVRPIEQPPVFPVFGPTPPPPPLDKEYITWTPAGGTTMILSKVVTAGVMLGGIDNDATAIIGLDLPPQEEFDIPLVGGGELANGRRWTGRQISLPIVIVADSLDELQVHRRALMTAFNPALGDGVLTIAYPSGDRRSLKASYSSGLDVALQGRMGSLYRDAFTVILRARDPYPYGEARSATFTPSQSFQFYAPTGDQAAVFYISGSTTTGDTTVTTDGEIEGWPVWTLRGPMIQATLTNRDSGQSLVITPNLATGQTLTIRTDPRTPPRRKFTRETGLSVWAAVAGQFPVMWSVKPGVNNITVLGTGTVPGQSSIAMTYEPRYFTA